MTTTHQTALQLPFPRDGVLDISPLYALTRTDTSVVPVRTPVGDPAWPVIAREESAIALSDHHLGTRRSPSRPSTSEPVPKVFAKEARPR